MIKTSYERMFEVIDALNHIPLDDTKFKYAVTKKVPAFNKISKKYQEETFDINLEFCSVYEDGPKKGTILKDDKDQFTFTKEATKAREAALRELRMKEDGVSYEPYFATLDLELAEKLGLGVLELLSGIIFREEDVKAVVAAITSGPIETPTETEASSVTE